MSTKTNWYDNLIDFVKQKISVVFWFFICSVILLFSSDKFLKLIYLDVFVNYVGPIIGFIFIASGALLLINLFILGKNKFIRHKEIERKKKLLKELRELFEIEELTSRFKSQEDCISWSNLVAPLLKFNEQYYANFVSNSHQINIIGFSGTRFGSLVNIMKSQLEMAIVELKNELNNQ